MTNFAAIEPGSATGAVGFHRGELAVQRQAGVEKLAARLTPMVERGHLSGGISAFLSSAPFVAITARDHEGRLWTSPVIDPQPSLQPLAPTTLRINASLPAADPLSDLQAGQPIGLIAMDFESRRRVRVNGIVTAADSVALTVEVDQAYGNCPKYIHLRSVQRCPPGDFRALMYHGSTLRAEDVDLMRTADTFMLGTTAPGAGNDSSHRGGPPGFVHVEDGCVWWLDYPGNNMFNSFGNLSVDPTAALLFVDFDTNAVLQISGTGVLHWRQPADDNAADTGRIVQFTPQQVIATQPVS
jgi:uncharacterized protein